MGFIIFMAIVLAIYAILVVLVTKWLDTLFTR